jgi:hypothetical protein
MDTEFEALDGARRQTASRCREQRSHPRDGGARSFCVPAGPPRRLLQVRVRSGCAARGSALPARCPDAYLGRATPDCMRPLRPRGRAIRRDLDRQPTRFGEERADDLVQEAVHRAVANSWWAMRARLSHALRSDRGEDKWNFVISVFRCPRGGATELEDFLDAVNRVSGGGSS